MPLNAIYSLTAECNYGGRITDPFDQILIGVLLNKYLNNQSPDPKYFPSSYSDYDSCIQFIHNLPIVSSPEGSCCLFCHLFLIISFIFSFF